MLYALFSSCSRRGILWNAMVGTVSNQCRRQEEDRETETISCSEIPESSGRQARRMQINDVVYHTFGILFETITTQLHTTLLRLSLRLLAPLTQEQPKHSSHVFRTLQEREGLCRTPLQPNQLDHSTAIRKSATQPDSQNLTSGRTSIHCSKSASNTPSSTGLCGERTRS